MEPPSPLNHVFVDYENVQEIDLSVIGTKGFTFTLLLGPQKKKLDVDLVEQLILHAASVELIRLAASGRNALDFALAYYLGRAVAADPRGFFHLISKDTGYDPLITHLRSRHVRVQRHADFATLSLSAPVSPKPTAVVRTSSNYPVVVKTTTKVETKEPLADPSLARVLEHLRKQANNRPRRRKTLLRHISSLLGKIGETEVEKLIQDLIDAGFISIDLKEAVAYQLPAIT